MTKDEAIKTIEVIKCEAEWEYPLDWQLALDMAIDALRCSEKPNGSTTEYSSDVISRQDAIALIIKAIHGTDNKEIQEYLFDGLRKQMWSLPSAEPKTGKWNRLSHDTFHCNLCGRTFIVMQGDDAMNYCPNCGAKMVREDGEE